MDQKWGQGGEISLPHVRCIPLQAGKDESHDRKEPRTM